MDLLKDLLTRLFLNFRTSVDGVALALIAWLNSAGVDLSEANRSRLVAWAGLIAASVWKFFSKDPVPAAEKPVGE
jgi:hypothetical protein